MRITLESVKAGESPFLPTDIVLIYSAERAAYWRSQGAGYTECQRDAGRYTMQDAWNRTAHMGPEKRIIFEYASRSLSPLEAALDKLRSTVRGGAVIGDEARSKRVELNHRHEWPALWAALDEALSTADQHVPEPSRPGA